MKRFVWLILLIGMISFTGFSSTTDLPENSDIAYCIDNDVGVSKAIIVVNHLQLDALQCETQYLVINKINDIATSFYPGLDEIYINEFKRKEKPPSTINIKLKASSQFIYKLARDGLNC